MNIDLSAALKETSPEEAQAVWEALGQFVENEAEHVEMAICQAEGAGVSTDGLDDDLRAASALLDRMNGIITALADSPL